MTSLRPGTTRCILYLLLFAGFLYLHMSHPAAMASPTLELSGNREVLLFGTNLAVLCGLGLVLAAPLLALAHENTLRLPDGPPCSTRP